MPIIVRSGIKVCADQLPGDCTTMSIALQVRLGYNRLKMAHKRQAGLYAADF
ncbi:MAG: hypothetical protein H6642_00460 [Caldilineaceae bacterium]|nr:hypothetical protein [Caldilineaceae bacterium]